MYINFNILENSCLVDDLLCGSHMHHLYMDNANLKIVVQKQGLPSTHDKFFLVCFFVLYFLI